MTDITKTCFFTGHRKILKEDLEGIKFHLKNELIKKYNDGINCFISGGALGFDTLAAQTVLELKKEKYSDIKLILYIPCYNYDENWSYEQKCILHHLKCAADDILIITKSNYTKDCPKKRNLALVKSSCCGIAYMVRERTGTSQTIMMAKKEQKEVINIAELLQ